MIVYQTQSQKRIKHRTSFSPAFRLIINVTYDKGSNKINRKQLQVITNLYEQRIQHEHSSTINIIRQFVNLSL